MFSIVQYSNAGHCRLHSTVAPITLIDQFQLDVNNTRAYANTDPFSTGLRLISLYELWGRIPFIC